MGFFTVETDAPDLSGWLWVAAAGLLVLELGRYTMVGGRPAGRLSRLIIALTLLLAASLGLIIRGPTHAAPAHLSAVSLLCVLSIIWLWRSYQRTTRLLSPFAQWSLLALRTLAVLIVLTIVVGPVLQWTHTIHERAAIGIALDNSRSMTIRDGLPPGTSNPTAFVSRLDAVKATPWPGGTIAEPARRDDGCAVVHVRP